MYKKSTPDLAFSARQFLNKGHNMNKSLKTNMILATLLAGLCSVSNAALITASDNAAWAGTGNQDESESFGLRNETYAFANNRTAYLRFALDPGGTTIGGIAFADITAVSLEFYVTSYSNTTTSQESDAIWILNDGITNPGTGGLSETTWTAANLTRELAPHDGSTDTGINDTGPDSSDGVNLISSPAAFSGTGLKSISLNVADFKTFLTNDTNGQISLVFFGNAGNTQVNVASVTNTDGFQAPTLNIIPEPSSLALLGLALAGLLTLRRRKG